MSFLTSNYHFIKFYTEYNSYNLVNDSVNVFNLSNRTNVQVVENCQNSLGCDDSIHIFSKKIKYLENNNIANKTLVLLACYPNSMKVFNNDEFHPYLTNKCYTLDEYTSLFKFLKSHDYDIINLDSKNVFLKDRIDFLSKHCKFMIGYEGGMAHLAHTLDIPSIILPWNHFKKGEGIDYKAHLLHLDSKTHFATLDEILSFNKDKFNDLIVSLQYNNTNNFFLQKSSKTLLEGNKLTTTLGNITIDISHMITDCCERGSMGYNFETSLYFQVAKEHKFKYGLANLKPIYLS